MDYWTNLHLTYLKAFVLHGENHPTHGKGCLERIKRVLNECVEQGANEVLSFQELRTQLQLTKRSLTEMGLKVPQIILE